jgi:predicted Zn-dependent protease
MISTSPKVFTRLAAAIVLLAFLSDAATSATVEVAPGVRVTKRTFSAPLNEQPFYGFAEKTPRMRQADEKFVSSIIQLMGTRQKAFDVTAKYAWRYFFADDFADAAKRFNEAFLLDPAQSIVYHGFGLIAFERFHDATYAEELLRVAERQPNPSRHLNADYGRFLLIIKRPRDAVPVLERAVVDDPKFATAWSNLAFARYLSGDRTGACDAAAEAARNAPPSSVRSDLQILRAHIKCSP